MSLENTDHDSNIAPARGWSLESLKAYCDARLDASRAVIQTALDSAATAVDKAERQQHQHNLQQNEWRATIQDLMGRVSDTARRDNESAITHLAQSTDAAIKAVSAKVTEAVERLDRNDGRSTVLAVIASALTAIMVGIVISLVVYEIHPFAGPVTSN